MSIDECLKGVQRYDLDGTYIPKMYKRKNGDYVKARTAAIIISGLHDEINKLNEEASKLKEQRDRWMNDYLDAAESEARLLNAGLTNDR